MMLRDLLNDAKDEGRKEGWIEGEAQGRKEGEAKGRIEGQKEGEVKGIIDICRKLNLGVQDTVSHLMEILGLSEEEALNAVNKQWNN